MTDRTTSSKGSIGDPDSTRERLLLAGLEEFAAKGYEKATVRDICSRANANLNSIKYHFGDKHDFYVAILELCNERLEPPSVPDVPLNAGAEQQLSVFIETMVKRAFAKRDSAGDPLAMQIMMREMQKPTAVKKAGITLFLVPIWKLLNSILGRLLPEDASPTDRQAMAFSVMGQIMFYRTNAPIMDIVLTKSEFKRFTANRVATHITRASLAMIRAYHEA